MSICVGMGVEVGEMLGVKGVAGGGDCGVCVSLNGESVGCVTGVHGLLMVDGGGRQWFCVGRVGDCSGRDLCVCLIGSVCFVAVYVSICWS